MSASYIPDEAATANGNSFIALLSQRDLSSRIPVNFVTTPGVSLTAACFPFGTFESGAAAKCFSNLLAVGFRRIDVDVYWDVTRRLWSLCPVELGNESTLSNATTSAPPQPAQSTTASLGSGQLTGNAAVRLPTSTAANLRRQATSSPVLSVSSGELSATSTYPSITTTTTLDLNATSYAPTSSTSSLPALPTSTDGTLVQIGPYSCTGTVTLDFLTNVYSSYLTATETNLDASMTYLVLNLHAAASARDPTGSARQPPAGSLPQAGNYLSNIMATNASSYWYTTQELFAERADLNSTGNWLGVILSERPVTGYYTFTANGARTSTPDGWPSEGWVESQKAKRFMAGIGQIDPQMGGYNFSADAAGLFPQGYISPSETITLAGNGQISNGCFFRSDVDTLSSVNSSWATYATGPSDTATLLAAAGNLTNCGISPLLNTTLNNVTADQDFRPYRAFAQSANWVWPSGEPKNATADPNTNDFALCAALNSSSGRLQSHDCNDVLYGACRVAGMPYTWTITSSQGNYMNVNYGCNSTSTFDVPRTALENQYLLSRWRQAPGLSTSASGSLLWVNFNNLDVATCWVVGQNSTCPYLAPRTDMSRQVVVPTVAAVIVFVLAALTVFVKCAANRTNTKRRRRRGDDGWDYEGVPS